MAVLVSLVYFLAKQEQSIMRGRIGDDNVAYQRPRT